MYKKRLVSERESIYYCLPVVSSTMLFAPMSILQGVYAKHYGMMLSTLAIILLFSRIFDAISDPIIGYYSDRYWEKNRTRKPLILLGGLLLLICGYFLYMPSHNVTPAYAGFWLIAFYMAYTLFEIPHITWPCDITNQSKDKTKLFSYRVFAGYSGLLIFYFIPLLPIFPTNEITLETLKFAFFVAVVLGLPSLFLAMRAVPSGQESSVLDPTSLQNDSDSLWESLLVISSNKPFLIFSGAFIFGGFGLGMWYGLIYIYVDAYLGMGDQFASLFLIAFGVGITATPFFYKAILKFEKKYVWIIIVIFIIFSFIFTGTLTQGETTFSELLFLKIIQSCGLVGSGIVVPAILSEITDYSKWKYGSEKSGTYFSIWVFLNKTSAALGTSLGLAVSSWYGLDVIDSSLSSGSISGLKMAASGIPTLLGITALIFVCLTPINDRRHQIIVRRLETHFVRN